MSAAIDSTVRPRYGSMCAATSTPRLFAALTIAGMRRSSASPAPTTRLRSRRSPRRGSRSSVRRSRACPTTSRGRSPGSTTMRCRSAGHGRPATSARRNRPPTTCRTTGSRTRTRGRPRPRWRAGRAQPVGRGGIAAFRGVRLEILPPGATDNGPSGLFLYADAVIVIPPRAFWRRVTCTRPRSSRSASATSSRICTASASQNTPWSWKRDR